MVYFYFKVHERKQVTRATIQSLQDLQQNPDLNTSFSSQIDELEMSHDFKPITDWLIPVYQSVTDKESLKSLLGHGCSKSVHVSLSNTKKPITVYEARRPSIDFNILQKLNLAETYSSSSDISEKSSTRNSRDNLTEPDQEVMSKLCFTKLECDLHTVHAICCTVDDHVIISGARESHVILLQCYSPSMHQNTIWCHPLSHIAFGVTEVTTMGSHYLVYSQRNRGKLYRINMDGTTKTKVYSEDDSKFTKLTGNMNDKLLALIWPRHLGLSM